MPNLIRALSLWQPWATLIAIGLKPYETRGWPTVYRGELAIHAAKTKECLHLLDESPFREAFNRAGLSVARVPLGALVCTCTLANCYAADNVEPDPWGDYSPGRFAFHLIEIKPLPKPIPCKGQQGFWTVDLDTGLSLPRGLNPQSELRNPQS